MATALIDESGYYTARTGRGIGLPAGEYQVAVLANELAPPEKVKPGVPPPDGKAITPEWYRSGKTSGLKYKIERGKNKIDLELTSQPPAGWNGGTPRGAKISGAGGGSCLPAGFSARRKAANDCICGRSR